MTTRRTTTNELRRCRGTARFGIEAHEAPISEFPKQPSREDGFGVMCTEHWRAYVKGLREARTEAQAAETAEVAPDPEPVDEPDEALQPAHEATLGPEAPTPRRTRRTTTPVEPEPAAA